jgi:hypothetical protein
MLYIVGLFPRCIWTCYSRNISVGVIETFSFPQGVLPYGENAPIGEVLAVMGMESGSGGRQQDEIGELGDLPHRH